MKKKKKTKKNKGKPFVFSCFVIVLDSVFLLSSYAACGLNRLNTMVRFSLSYLGIFLCVDYSNNKAYQSNRDIKSNLELYVF